MLKPFKKSKLAPKIMKLKKVKSAVESKNIKMLSIRGSVASHNDHKIEVQPDSAQGSLKSVSSDDSDSQKH
jgi:hypothetical protein